MYKTIIQMISTTLLVGAGEGGQREGEKEVVVFAKWSICQRSLEREVKVRWSRTSDSKEWKEESRGLSMALSRLGVNVVDGLEEG